MKYVSGWSVWGIYTSPSNPSTDILRSPAYEDGTEVSSETSAIRTVKAWKGSRGIAPLIHNFDTRGGG